MTHQVEPLLLGEQALDNAPNAELADGRRCIPQHYLFYQHTLGSVEALILDIEFDSRHPIFVSQDEGGLYIQVGIIGHDNYLEQKKQKHTKLVYGRKWRIDPQLPSSEIIQTIFLALKKAREHEVRERFRLTHDNKTTTPFNNHHDLPLLIHSRDRLETAKPGKAERGSNETELSQFKQTLAQVLKTVSYANAQFELSTVVRFPSGYCVVELTTRPKDNYFKASSELSENTHLHLTLEDMSINTLLQQMMQQLIILSDRYVDEHFRYRHFNRFSWRHDVHAIAKISSEVRQLHKQTESKQFSKHWQKTNYESDRRRIPVVEKGPLWLKIKQQLADFSPTESTLPITR